ETCKVVDVVETVVAGLVVRLRSGIAEFGHLVREQPAREAHLVEVGVARERQQTRVLVLPPEAPDAGVSRGFHDRDPEHLAADLAMRALALLAGDVDEGLIGNRFDESIPQEVQRQAVRPDRLRLGHPLLDLGVGKRGVRTDGAIIDERAARDDLASMRDGEVRISETPIGSSMPHAQLRDLARATRARVLLALAAGLRVVQWPAALLLDSGLDDLV